MALCWKPSGNQLDTETPKNGGQALDDDDDVKWTQAGLQTFGSIASTALEKLSLLYNVSCSQFLYTLCQGLTQLGQTAEL